MTTHWGSWETFETNWRRLGNICDKLESIWNKLRRVWVNVRHIVTSQARLGQVSRHSDWPWDELRWLRDMLSDVMTIWWWLEKVMGKIGANEATTMSSTHLLWSLGTFGTLVRWLRDALRHFELLCDKYRRVRNVWDELRRQCVRLAMDSKYLRGVRWEFTKHLQQFRTIIKVKPQ